MPVAPNAPEPRRSNAWDLSETDDGRGTGSGDSMEVARQLDPVVEDQEDPFDELWAAEDASFANAAVS